MQFDTEVLSVDEAKANLSQLRSRGGTVRGSKFDPLKQHIKWLERGQALKIEEMRRADVANLRSYIDRNIEPVGKGLHFVVRSSRVDDEGELYRVFVFCRKEE